MRWVCLRFKVFYHLASYCPKNDIVFERWRTGNAGDDFVDANMRELLLTRWMSKRGRQNVAGYLVKDLLSAGFMAQRGSKHN